LNNLDFESITSFEIVKRIVKLEKVSEEKAHQELKKSFEEYTNHKINDLYRKIQLMNLEII
jgi:tRNA nucleotidyltransferase/poly(A) polymerase